MKNNKVRLLIGGVVLVVIALMVLVIKIPTASNKLTSNASTNGNKSAVSYNILDSAAILGAFAIARQVPATTGKELDTFISSLAAAKAGTGRVDLGVLNNTLADYSVDPAAGVKGTVCFAVKPPTISTLTPGQAQWVLYFEPAVGKKSALVIMSKGITTCADALKAAGTVANADRGKVSDASRALAKTAILSLPSSALTKTGLYMLDEARGLVNNAPASTTTPNSPTTTTPTTSPTAIPKIKIKKH